MTSKSDDRLRDDLRAACGRDLRAAYGRDLPGEEFVDAVLDRVGGAHDRVREISVPAPGRRRLGLWLGIGLAAAAAVLVAALGLRGGGEAGEAGDVPDDTGRRFAGPEDPPAPVEVPRSETARDTDDEARLVINVSKDGRIVIEDDEVPLADLAKVLAKKAEGTRGANDSSTLWVRIRADRRVNWRQIQWIMQACADPSVRIFRISFAADAKASGEEKEIPVPRPKDRGLRLPGADRVQLKVRLRIVNDGEAPTLELLGESLGSDEAAWADLATRVTAFRAKLPDGPILDADRRVPFAAVVRALDVLIAAGYESIVFVGAPPPSAEDHAQPDRVIFRLRRDGDSVVAEFPVGSEPTTVDAAVVRLLARLRALREAGLTRIVTIVADRDVPDEVVARHRSRIEAAGNRVRVLREE